MQKNLGTNYHVSEIILSNIFQKQFFILLLATTISSAAFAEEKLEDIKLLRKIAVLQKSNQERLTTWSGKAEINSKDNLRPEEGIETRIYHAHFSYDKDRNAWGYRSQIVDSNYDKLIGIETGGFYKNNTWHSLFGAIPGQTAKGFTIQPNSSPDTGPMSEIFDPRYFFLVRGSDLQSRIENLITHIDSDWLTLDIEQEGTVVTLTAGNRTIPFAKATYQFDLAKSANLIHLSAVDNRVAGTWEYHWEQVNSVWVPTLFSYQQVKTDGTLNVSREITWMEYSVNEPIDENVFTLEGGLGATKGDAVTDHRTMSFSRIGMPDSITKKDADSTNLLEADSPTSYKTAIMLIAGNLLVLGIIVALFIIRRSR